LGADRIKIIVEGSDRSTNAQVARGIATFVAKPADIELDLRHSAGPPDTLAQLREGSSQQFALLQADAAEALLSATSRGNIEASQFLAPIRVIAPLHEEDIYFLARSDSPLSFVHEIESARINLGPLNGSTALTVATLYRLMFNSAIPERNASFHSDQVALVKLTEGAVDVVVLMSPYPARRLADMKTEARRFVKLLKFDRNHPNSARILKVYSEKVIPAAKYHNLLDDDLSTLAVKILLVSHGMNEALQVRFAKSWCQNLPRLREQGHPVLHGMGLDLPQLSPGWQYAESFTRELNICMHGSPDRVENCPHEDRTLCPNGNGLPSVAN